MTHQNLIDMMIRIYRTDRLGEQPRNLYRTPEQGEYLGRFVGLLSRGMGIWRESIKAEEEARIADLVDRFEQHDTTITTVSK